MSDKQFPNVQVSDRTAGKAIVVLGAAVWEGERPSHTLLRRARHTAKLYFKGEAALIVCSGGLGRHPPSEAEMIKRILLKEGVPVEVILIEDRSHTTRENVLFSAQILRDRLVRSVIVVSDKYHLPRALICFWALGFASTGSGPDRADTGTPLHKWLFSYLRELVALPWYLAKLSQLRRDFQQKVGG